ncbi:MAG: SAM-dependent chlorinase/fluorinase [Bacteroidetes bacterium]|nr:SAM-dependent chlorinase/fluorinase [Bacteroidota bacterium]
MRPLKSDIFALFFLILLLAASCHKSEVTTPAAAARQVTNLVLISDNVPGSDMIVGITGAVRSMYPAVNIQFYQSKPFDVYDGAYLLFYSVLNYPKGTCFAGIVEPGASSRRIIYKASDVYVIAPDNTLSTRILDFYSGITCYYIENPLVLGGDQPGTLSIQEFYKRAILSLISGTELSTFGSVCATPNKFLVQDPIVSGDTIKGEILFTDNFGNCITNIPQGLVSAFPAGTVLSITSDTTHVSLVMGLTYSSVPTGSNVCFINSSLRLELAINYGNFSGKYHLGAGSRVALRKP